MTALGIGFVHRRGRISLDTTIGVLFTGMFALGVYLMSQQRSYAIDLQSFLFGDILAVQPQDLRLIVALSVVVAIAVVVLYRGLLYTTFDPVVAQASGIASPAYEYTLLVMLALTIVVSLQAVGIVLVAALLVTPAAAAFQLTSRFAPMMALSAADRRRQHRRRPVPLVLRACLERRDDRSAGDAALLCRGHRQAVRSRYCTRTVNGAV